MNSIIEEIKDIVFNAEDYIKKEYERKELLKKEVSEQEKRNSILNSFGIISHEESDVSTKKYNLKLKGLQNEISAIQKYSLDYPNVKFVSERVLQRVMTKYGLLINSPENFIGKIPIKNQEEIVNSNLPILSSPRPEDYSFHVIGHDSHEVLMNFGEDDSIEEYKKRISTYIKSFVKRVDKSERFAKKGFWEFRIADTNVSVSGLYMCHTETKEVTELVTGNDIVEGIVKVYNVLKVTNVDDIDFHMTNNLRIIATPDYFKKNKGYEFISDYEKERNEVKPFFKTKFTDPIVCCKMKNVGGVPIYGIITAWGEESQDPEIFNETLN